MVHEITCTGIFWLKLGSLSPEMILKIRSRSPNLTHHVPMLYPYKGIGSRTCRIGLVNLKKINFHEQHLFSCVNPLLSCYRVLNMGWGAMFWPFLVIFTSLTTKLIRGTATLHNEILTVLRFDHSWDSFCKQGVPFVKNWKNLFFFTSKNVKI